MEFPKISIELGTECVFDISLLKEWNEEVKEGLLNLLLLMFVVSTAIVLITVSFLNIFS